MSYDGMAMYSDQTIASPTGRRVDACPPHGRGSPATPPRGATPSRVRVPVRGSSVITGLDRSCRAELIGFAAPIGRLSAILRIIDEATGTTATSVVPVEFPAPLG